MNIRQKLILLALLSTASHSQASTLPTSDQVQGVINLCSAGRSVNVKGNLQASLTKWLSGAKGRIDIQISDIGAMLNEIEDDSIKKEALSAYHSCVKNSLEQYLNKEEISKADEKKTSGTSDQDTPVIISNGNDNKIVSGGQTTHIDSIHVGTVNGGMSF